MKTAIEVLDAFENIRRAQRAGSYAPHKPLLILLALARVQRGEPCLVEFATIEDQLKQLLAEFGPSSGKHSVNPLSAGYEQSTLAKFLRSGYSQISLTGMS